MLRRVNQEQAPTGDVKQADAAEENPQARALASVE
jgi:hypothetical protein